ncbi:hypothetical protein NSK_001871 [Nannochloropsis salina CCMP1776]|jgi:hypothetical protein|uniref:Uncharacterized protein n=1 Tax=Nannochloropsis salina CCMP1776 TaxID=1027361 RepID=A0A4D9D9T5_9STRA|nr:hypothetical protein NSK_001871 [Nannochloropsis salina CCMP1776]|eukprot:TFJ86783.1 hypothetical protein NSK_001871 [Nannochloropsis salina CCMP1776]
MNTIEELKEEKTCRKAGKAIWAGASGFEGAPRALSRGAMSPSRESPGGKGEVRGRVNVSAAPGTNEDVASGELARDAWVRK